MVQGSAVQWFNGSMKTEHFATSPPGKWPLGDSIADVEDIEAWQLARAQNARGETNR